MTSKRYKFLDARMVGTAAKMVAAKVVVDQAITAPPILATFFVGKKVGVIIESSPRRTWPQTRI